MLVETTWRSVQMSTTLFWDYHFVFNVENNND